MFINYDPETSPRMNKRTDTGSFCKITRSSVRGRYRCHRRERSGAEQESIIREDRRKLGQITVTKTEIDGLLIVEPQVHKDDRGFFMETYNQKDMQEAGLDMVFVQDNHSMSVRGVLRGLHFQKQYPQGKLVRVIRGEVFDVAVDLRENSPTFGKWHGIILSEENKKQFYISEGFAHGFLVLSETAEFLYKVTDFYRPGDESGLAWNDPEIGIEWPQVTGTYRGNADSEGYSLEDGTPLILSEKDKYWKGLSETFHFGV